MGQVKLPIRESLISHRALGNAFSNARKCDTAALQAAEELNPQILAHAFTQESELITPIHSLARFDCLVSIQTLIANYPHVTIEMNNPIKFYVPENTVYNGAPVEHVKIDYTDNDYNYTPLGYIYFKYYSSSIEDVITWFIDNGANLNIVDPAKLADDTKSILIDAIDNNRDNIALAIINSGNVNIDYQTPITMQTALMRGVIQENVEIVTALLDLDPQPDLTLTDSDTNTAQMLATTIGNQDIIDLFV